jgi:hypothetical protein
MMTSWSEVESDYQRRIFIKDNFLAIQLIVNDIPTKEYGFDFQSKLYYESDLINKDYRKFLFSKINEEYAKIKTRNLQSAPGMNMLSAMAGNVGAVTYKVKSSKSIFRRKKIGGLNCTLFRFEIGPGYSEFSTFSWGKDMKAWVTKDIPNYSQYENVASQLKKECTFYLAKSNEISDFIITLMYSDGFPIEGYDSTKRDFGMGRSMQDSRSSVSLLDTKPIPDTALSYLRDKDAFILNAEEMKSNKPQDIGMPMPFMGQRNMPKSKQLFPQFLQEETMLDKVYIFIIPVLFYLGLAYYAFKHITRRTSAPISGKLTLSFYRLVIFLYVLQIVHIFIPYFKSIGMEFSIISILASVIIIGGHHLELANNRKQAMSAPNAKICPHCKAVIDKIYVICPNCGKKAA